jgi:hypothetical protein
MAADPFLLLGGGAKEAIELLEYIVRVDETVIVEIHPDRLVSQHELATACYRDRRVRKDIKLLKRVLRFEKTILAETHPDRLASRYIFRESIGGRTGEGGHYAFGAGGEDPRKYIGRDVPCSTNVAVQARNCAPYR